MVRSDIVMSVCLFIASDMPLIKFTSFLLVFESFITHFVVFLPGIIAGLLYISREQKRKPLYQQILLKGIMAFMLLITNCYLEVFLSVVVNHG